MPLFWWRESDWIWAGIDARAFFLCGLLFLLGCGRDAPPDSGPLVSLSGGDPCKRGGPAYRTIDSPPFMVIAAFESPIRARLRYFAGRDGETGPLTPKYWRIATGDTSVYPVVPVFTEDLDEFVIEGLSPWPALTEVSITYTDLCNRIRQSDTLRFAMPGLDSDIPDTTGPSVSDFRAWGQILSGIRYGLVRVTVTDATGLYDAQFYLDGRRATVMHRIVRVSRQGEVPTLTGVVAPVWTGRVPVAIEVSDRFGNSTVLDTAAVFFPQ